MAETTLGVSRETRNRVGQLRYVLGDGSDPLTQDEVIRILMDQRDGNERDTDDDD